MPAGDPDEESDTLKGLVAAGRGREGTALRIGGRAAPYSYRELFTNVWKAGNLFGHYGVHALGELALVVGSKTGGSAHRGALDSAEPLLALFGGAIVGAVVDITPEEPVDAPALVAPARTHTTLGAAPGCSRLAYGGPPAEPAISHFERELWSENPVEPPESVAPEDGALRANGQQWTHGELLAAAADVVDAGAMTADSTVVMETTLDDVGSVVAGVIAPLAVGATVVVPALGDERATGEPGPAGNTGKPGPAGDRVVVRGGERDAECERVVSAARLTRSMRDTRRV